MRRRTVTKFEKLNANIADDLRIVRERVVNEDLTVAPEPAESRVRDWSETVVLALNPPDHWLMMLPMSFSVEENGRIAAAALEDLVEVVATYGFGDRLEVEDSVAATRAKMFGLAICTALVGLILAFFWIFYEQADFTAMQIAEGSFTDQIASNRRDELGRLMNSLAISRVSSA